MPKRVEFFYDYASPFSYLADQRLPQIVAKHGAELIYRPAILGVLVTESGNQPPPTVPAKIKYLGADTARWVKRLGIAYTPNPFFPVRSITIMRGALVAQRDGFFAQYHQALWRAMWTQAANLADNAVIAEVLQSAGLDAQRILAATQDEAIKAQLKANCDEGLRRGAFGMPTFFVGEEMFFGNDRLDFLEEALA